MASPAYADVVDAVTVTHRAAMKSEIRQCWHTSLQKEPGDLSRGAVAMRRSMAATFAVVRTGRAFMDQLTPACWRGAMQCGEACWPRLISLTWPRHLPEQRAREPGFPRFGTCRAASAGFAGARCSRTCIRSQLLPRRAAKRSSGAANKVRMQVKRRRFESVTSRLSCSNNPLELLHTKNVHQLSVLHSASAALWRIEAIWRRDRIWMKSHAAQVRLRSCRSKL